MGFNRCGWWAGSRYALSLYVSFGFGGPDARSRRGDMPECSCRAVWLVAAEHLCGERWVVGEPSVM